MRQSSILASLALAASMPASAADETPSQPATAAIAFTSTEADFPNPERGFYRAGGTDLARIDPAFLDRVFGDGYRLVYALLDLSRFRTGPIPADQLAALDRGFAAARQAGVKLIVRAVYNYPQGETGYQAAKDAALPIVLGHLGQLKPLLASNADVIAYVQAGFIGAWGEWHSSSNGLTTPAARARIRDAILDAVPGDRFVQFRYPPDLDAWTPPVLRSLPSGLQGALRTGFHNDCFLASQTDVGTFPEEPELRARLQARMADLTALAPFGGETCNPADDPGAVPRTGCDDIRREGARFHLTYLNADYYRRLFHERWATQGCMDEVERRMGYRLALTRASLPADAARGQPLRIDVQLSNHGWARPYNARRAEIVLVSQGNGRVYRLTDHRVDPRQWLPGASHTLALDVALPPAMETGVYDVAFALPDADAKLARDPRYAIRPANADDARRGQRWDATIGAFRLGAAISVR
jgi:hypothetical protein